MSKRGWNLRKGNPDGDRGRSLGGQSHSQEHMAKLARRGWQALVDGRGLFGAHDVLRQWRLAHPSELEQIVADALNGLGAEYEREVVLTDGERFSTLDFTVGKVAIEVDGAMMHGGKLTHEKQSTYDAIKAELCQQAGFRLVRLPESVVRNGRLRTTLLEAIG